MKYYVVVNRGDGAVVEAYETKQERDRIVSWQSGRKITRKDACKYANWAHLYKNLGTAENPAYESPREIIIGGNEG